MAPKSKTKSKPESVPGPNPAKHQVSDGPDAGRPPEPEARPRPEPPPQRGPWLSESQIRDRRDEAAAASDDLLGIVAAAGELKKSAEGLLVRLDRLEQSRCRTAFARGAGFQRNLGVKSVRMCVGMAAAALLKATSMAGRVRSAASALQDAASDPDVPS